MLNHRTSRSKGHIYGSPRDGDSPGKGEYSQKSRINNVQRCTNDMHGWSLRINSVQRCTVTCTVQEHDAVARGSKLRGRQAQCMRASQASRMRPGPIGAYKSTVSSVHRHLPLQLSYQTRLSLKQAGKKGKHCRLTRKLCTDHVSGKHCRIIRKLRTFKTGSPDPYLVSNTLT